MTRFLLFLMLSSVPALAEDHLDGLLATGPVEGGALVEWCRSGDEFEKGLCEGYVRSWVDIRNCGDRGTAAIKIANALAFHPQLSMVEELMPANDLLLAIAIGKEVCRS